MKESSRHLLCLILVVGIATVFARPGMAQSQESTALPPDTPPFRVPFDQPPGPSTWYISQFYGNTQFAYEYGDRWYQAGQGLHFGIDFDAKCGIPIAAIGDGRVVAVDNQRHGAGPHNLLIRHDEVGVVSLYGHLLERPALSVGDRVTKGQPVALVGDPDLTCTSRPHLHLEIRSLGRGTAYNPVDFIEADWDTLALFGLEGGFQQNLRHPRQWMTPYDQPVIDLWGPILNDYAATWPPDWNFR